MQKYMNAEICQNGHLISKNLNNENHEEYCSKCGEKTIRTCPNCGTPIKGLLCLSTEYQIYSNKEYRIPSYCYNCGKPFPWIENNLKKLNAILLLDNILSDDEKGILRQYLPDIPMNDDNTLTSAALVKAISDRAAPATKQFIIEFIKSVSIAAVSKLFGL